MPISVTKYMVSRTRCFYTIAHLKRPPLRAFGALQWAFFISALVTVTLQPINYLLYLDYSAKGRIIIYNRHFKGAKVYYEADIEIP